MKGIVLFALFAVGIFAAKSWTGNGGTNLWNDPANWNPQGIPSYTDDVTIKGASVQLSQWNGGSANSLTISGNSSFGVQGTSLTVGSLSLQDAASFKIDAGNGTVTVNGTASIASTSGVQYLSGSLRGDWKVQAKSFFNFGQASQLVITGSLSNLGTVSSAIAKVQITVGSFSNGVGGSASFTGGSLTTDNLVNDGVLTFTSQTVFVTTSGSGSGKITIRQTILSGIFTNVDVEDSLSSLTGVINGLSIALGQTVSTSNIQLFNPSGGAVSAVGDITLSGTIALAKLTYVGGTRPGPIIITGTGSISVISLAYNGEKYLTYSSSTPLKVSLLEQLAGDVHLSGVWSPDSLSIEGNAITIPAGVTLTCPDSYIAAHVDLDGTFTIPAAGKLNSTVGSHWALISPGTQGTLANNGVITVSGGSTPVVFDGITYTGSGSIIISGAFDLEEATFTFNDISLRTTTSRITGESVTLSYSSLTGPEVGQVIQFLADDNQFTCTSPCGALAAQKYQSFNLWMRQ